MPFLLAFITKYSRKELSAAELGNKVHVKGEKKEKKARSFKKYASKYQIGHKIASTPLSSKFSWQAGLFYSFAEGKASSMLITLSRKHMRSLQRIKLMATHLVVLFLRYY